MHSKPISEQLRAAIRDSGLSRYAIHLGTGIDQAALSRFVRGERGLSVESIDAIGLFLGVQLVTKAKRAKRKGAKS